jgi:hypothetical protein
MWFYHTLVWFLAVFAACAATSPEPATALRSEGNTASVVSGWLDYQVGETAREDIITPMPLVVIDAEATEALKKKEAFRVPVICRYYTNALDEALRDLDAGIATTRSNLLRAAAAEFKHSPLSAAEVDSDQFLRFVSSFQSKHKGFPVSTNLAQLWARGESEPSLAPALAEAVREAMAFPLRPASIPPEVKFGATVRLVPLPNWSAELTLEMVEKYGINFSRSNIFAFTRARDTLIQEFSPEDRSVAKFLASLLKTNCLPDAELTFRARALRTEAIVAADHYDVAQVIVRQGQVIDRKIKAALDQLREKTAIGTLQQQLHYDQVEARQTSLRYYWLVGGLAVLLAALLLVIWRLVGRRQVVTLVPAQLPSGQASVYLPALPAPESSNLPALASGSPEHGELHERLLPHLARLLMDKLVRRLISQRSVLVDAQTRAAADIADLEKRLEIIHAPLQDRLRAYEQRITELEKELAQKGEENRELIRAKIELTRKQLSATKERLDLN